MMPGGFERADALGAGRRRSGPPPWRARRCSGARPAAARRGSPRRWRRASSCGLAFLERQERRVAARRGRVDGQRALARRGAPRRSRRRRPTITGTSGPSPAASVRAKLRGIVRAAGEQHRIGRGAADRTTRTTARRVHAGSDSAQHGVAEPCAAAPGGSRAVAAMHATRPRGCSDSTFDSPVGPGERVCRAVGVARGRARARAATGSAGRRPSGRCPTGLRRRTAARRPPRR